MHLLSTVRWAMLLAVNCGWVPALTGCGPSAPSAPASRSSALTGPTSWEVLQDATTGAFSPFRLELNAGDSVVWHFPTPSPGNALARRVSVPELAEPPTPAHHAIAGYAPSNVNELVGPMLQVPSGVFALGPTGYGMSEQNTPCSPAVPSIASRTVAGTTQYLCRSPDPDHYGRTMPETWARPDITGVFIRLQWKDLQPTQDSWDDSILLRETDAAVAAGKLYSLVLESGRDGQPPWLFEPVESGGAGMPALELIWNDALDVARCSDVARFVDPTTESYRTLYLAALSHISSVLRESSARYRSLAYIKPSGANRATGENRLPSRCKPGCSICNNQVWADAGYQPSKLYAFYEAQLAHISREFPGKTMSYMLIQAGFPRVGESGCYENAAGARSCPADTPIEQQSVPRGTEQTEAIIAAAAAAYPALGSFVVEHQGLGMELGSINPWVIDFGATGRPTMFQTSAGGQVGSPAQVGDTLQNLWDNSAASALEIYEERLWEAHSAPLGAAAHPERRIEDWQAMLHARRRDAYPELGDPAPSSHTFTFAAPVTPTEAPPGQARVIAYLDPRLQAMSLAADCEDGFSPCIVVHPLTR